MSEIKLKEVLKLFQDKHTSDLYQRLAHALKKIGKLNKEGFQASELDSLADILDILSDLITAESVEEYQNGLGYVLKALQQPFQFSGSSEVAQSHEPIQKLFQSLAKLLQSSLFEIILPTLSVFSSSIIKKKSSIKSISPAHFSEIPTIFARTNLIPNLLTLLRLSSDESSQISASASDTILSIMRHLSFNEKTCTEMNNHHAIEACMNAITWTNDIPQIEDIEAVIDILWGLLDAPSNSQLCSEDIAMSEIPSIWFRVYKWSVERQLLSKHGKSLRNDILILLMRQCHHQPSLINYLDNTSLIDVLLQHSSSSLIKSCKFSSRFSTQSIDFQFTKLILVLLEQFASTYSDIYSKASPENLDLFVSSLTHYLTPPTQIVSGKCQTWTQAQFSQLQLSCIGLFASLASELPSPLLEKHNVTSSLCQLLEWVRDVPVPLGSGIIAAATNAFQSTDFSMTQSFSGSTLKMKSFAQTGSNKLTPIAKVTGLSTHTGLCLETLRCMLTFHPEFTDIFHQGGGLTSTISVLERETYSSTLPIEATSKLQTLAMMLLLNVFENKPGFQNDSYDVIFPCVLEVLQPPVTSALSSTQHDTMVAALGLIRVMLQQQKGLVSFIKSNGCFLLMDLLDRRIQSHQHLLITILLELSSFPDCLGLISRWQSKTSKRLTSFQLLLSIFESISQFDEFLNHDKKLEESSVKLRRPSKELAKRESIDEILQNAKGAIYLLARRIQSWLAQNEISIDLSPDEEFIACILDHYLEIKSSEVWQECMQALHKTVTPTDEDQELLRTVRAGSHELFVRLQQAKTKLREQKLGLIAKIEQREMTKLAGLAQQEMQQAQRFQDYVRQTGGQSQLV